VWPRRGSSAEIPNGVLSSTRNRHVPELQSPPRLPKGLICAAWTVEVALEPSVPPSA
jgi:hypothetical protein